MVVEVESVNIAHFPRAAKPVAESSALIFGAGKPEEFLGQRKGLLLKTFGHYSESSVC